ncbi:MAG: SBBP repeat-containing protein [Nitrospirae bacterium]|nr:SBBP repeat-containing protein [Nitrospirota bacterium]
MASARESTPPSAAATVRFEPNVGQANPEAQAIARGKGFTALFTRTGITYLFPGSRKEGRAGVDTSRLMRGADPPPPPTVIRLKWIGAQETGSVEWIEPLDARSNYIKGRDPSRWRVNVPLYGRLRYAGLYPGIDVEFYGRDGHLEYDLVVSPDANLGGVRLEFEGTPTGTDSGGDLVVEAPAGRLRQLQPTAYQVVAGERRPVRVTTTTDEHGRVGFRLGPHDSSTPVTLDPVLTYSSYLGGTDSEFFGSIATDAAGQIFVTGETFSVNFPLANPFQDLKLGLTDAYVSMFDSSGSSLVFSTYLGGSGSGGGTGSDRGWGIAVSDEGTVYVAGYTDSADFPTKNPFQAAIGGEWDAFVTVLDGTGATLVYSTYLGGRGTEVTYAGIALQTDGRFVVVGTTGSDNFPLANPYQDTLKGFGDAFITMFDASGQSLTYSTYFGGSSDDQGDAFAMDELGAVYFTGLTGSGDLPLVNPFQNRYGGLTDAYVAKLTPTGDNLAFSTYLGGGNIDAPAGIAVDASGSAYVVGLTWSAGFPLLNPFQSQKAGFYDAFITKFQPSGSQLAYSTFLGGKTVEVALSVAVHSDSRATVVGYTASPDFPIVAPLQSQFAGGIDAFITQFEPAGSALRFSTFLGGSSDDIAEEVVLDTAGQAYLGGESESPEFPTVRPFQRLLAGEFDGVVMRIALGPETCRSTALDVAALQTEVAALAAPPQVKQALTTVLNQVQADLDQADYPQARSDLVTFKEYTVKASNAGAVVLGEANGLICGAANVLNNVPLP